MITATIKTILSFSIVSRCLSAGPHITPGISHEVADRALEEAAAGSRIGVMQVVEDLFNNRSHIARRHRQFTKIGETVHTCMVTLNQSSSLGCMQQVQESERDRKMVCKTANDWPRREQKPREFDSDNLASAGVLFVVSSYVSNSDNARIFALSLASIFVHHQTSDVLIVDQQSPVEGADAMHKLLLDWELKKKKRMAAQSSGDGVSHQTWGSVSIVRPPWPSACRKIPCAFPDDVSFSGENASAHQEPYYLPPPSGKEIGALQEAFRFVESRGKLETNPAPPSMVVLLQHSTGTIPIS